MKQSTPFIFLLFISFFVHAQLPFTPVKAYYKGNKLILPKEAKYDVLFRAGDTILSPAGIKTCAKEDHDLNVYIPENGSSVKGKLYVSHECNDSSSLLGDGGGGSVLDIEFKDDHWKTISTPQAIDFTTVGDTYDNCGGTITATGTILSAEEYPPVSNAYIYRKGKGIRDTSDFRGLKKHQNQGWVVEVDIKQGIALRKLYAMGRFSHEGILLMPDNKTVYMTDDEAPSVFFKFVATVPNNFSVGQLYAFKQNPESMSGEWITLPMHMDSLINIRSVALRMGATYFVRTEWITRVGNRIFLTETGRDSVKISPEKMFAGKPAYHLLDKIQGNYLMHRHGAVLEFDSETNTVKPLVFGGAGKGKHFSGPDALNWCKINGKEWLVINEDITSTYFGKVEGKAAKKNFYVNEIWWLDLSIPNPTVDDLQRFLVAPNGSESTGSYFTPDFSTYFVNIQHPTTTNPKGLDKSFTIAVKLGKTY